MSFWDRLENTAKKNENCVALLFHNEQITYKELYSKANNYAYELLNRGVNPGENVSIIGRRSIEVFACILGIMKVDAVFVIIDAEDDINKIEYRIRNSKCRFTFTDDPFLTNDLMVKCISLREIYLRESPRVNAVRHSAMDTMYLAYTSGTTEKEKAVMVSYENLESYIDDFILVFAVCDEDINVQQTPLGYDGLCEELFSMLITGGTLLLLDKYILQNPRLLHKELIKNNVTLFPTTPLILNEMNKLPPIATIKRYISCADVLKKYNYSNLINTAKIYNTYGPTETTVCSTFYLCKEDDDLNTPIGKALPSYRVEVVNGDMLPTIPGQVGEIIIGGRGVAKGYYDNDFFTKEKFIVINGERFFRTGDYGYYDSLGVLRFEGRRDSVEKLKGIKVDCSKIENVLMNSQKVSTCIAHVCSHNGNSMLCMFYVPINETVSEDSIKEYMKEKLSRDYLPKVFILVDRIPQKTIGKVDYTELETVFSNIRPANKEINEKNQKGFLSTFQNVLSIDMVSMTDSLYDLGVDSLFFIQIVLELERLFDFEFDDENLSYGNYNTVGDIYKYVIKKQQI